MDVRWSASSEQLLQSASILLRFSFVLMQWKLEVKGELCRIVAEIIQLIKNKQCLEGQRMKVELLLKRTIYRVNSFLTGPSV